jgi:translation initiation factor IF-1
LKQKIYIQYYNTLIEYIMVKNTKGGKGAKSMARKSFATGTSNKLRVSEDPLEIYVTVTKLFGHGRCEVVGADGKKYMMHIRKKYRGGRGRRENEVKVGSKVLCGIRSWELESRTLDLLSVYDESEVCELLKLGVLFVVGGVGGGVDVDGDGGDDEGWEYGDEGSVGSIVVEGSGVVLMCSNGDDEINVEEI